ncbi:MAG: radical SAM protein [Patescibacteria group bacterium]
MLLINSSSKDTLKIFQSFFPVTVPMGVGCLIAAAEKEGIKISFIDEQVEGDMLSEVRNKVACMEKPYIFGFSVVTAGLKSSLVLSRELKRLYPGSVVVFGGVHPTAMPDEVLSYGHIDIVVRGEGEEAIVEIYKCIKAGEDFSHIGNISYRRDGEVVHNKKDFLLYDIDSYPPFPYHIFSPDKYDLGFVMSSRGCPYKCIFCSNRVTTALKYRYSSTEAIVNVLDLLHHQYGKTHIGFLDDNFLVNKDRVYKLVDDIRKKGWHKKMTFSFQARGDNVDPSILKALYDTGFNSIFFGLETASEKIMKTIKKGETVAQCISAVEMAKKIGFQVSATFIYGLPGDTHEDRMDCVKLSKKLKLDMVRFNNATPYPGTELYEIAKIENRLNIQGVYENFVSVSTFIENPLRPIPFTYIPVGNTEAQIRRDLLFSYFSFYLDIEKIKSIFARPDKNLGWFNAGEKFSKTIKKLPALGLLGIMFLLKFAQLFYYTVIKKETRISFQHFLKIFDGLRLRGRLAG